jgi:hypothetical protein
MQHYDGTWNAESRILKANQSDLAAVNLLRAASSGEGDGVLDPLDFRDIAFKVAPNGEVFILKGVLNIDEDDGTVFNGYLIRTTMGLLATANPDPVANPDGVLISDLPIPATDYIPIHSEDPTEFASLWALLYSPDDDAVWLAKDDVLVVYRFDETVLPPDSRFVEEGTMSIADGLAPAGSHFEKIAMFGHMAPLRGAKDPNKVSTKAPAAAEAEAAEDEEGK